MQFNYAWNGSRLHLLLEESVADAYNRAMQAYFDAQKNHEILHGRKWDPVNEPILINWTSEEQKAWDDVARLVNLMVEINGGGLDIPEEECTSDFLVKIE